MSARSRPRRLRGALLRGAALLLCLSAGAWPLPAWYCRRGTARWAGPIGDVHRRHAAHVQRWVERPLAGADFATGSERFDGEWLFGSYMMAGMGFGQMALASRDADQRARWSRALRACVERLQQPRVSAFDRTAWREEPLTSLAGDQGHAAYLGYLNLVLGLDRLLDPATPHAPLHDRISAALARRLAASALLLLQTYPREVYPVDNCAVAASLALHDRATGRPTHAALLARWTARLLERHVDAQTGLLIQAVHPRTGEPLDHGRGSGTALASYFLSFLDPALSRRFYQAMRRECYGELLGFGMMREYRRGVSGWGDIDSGPVILGYGISASGFSLAGARIHGDRATLRRLMSTAVLYGAPSGDGFVTGGPLGNAILFAMLTARIEPRP